jgi:Tol biopolymer transport system component
MHRFHGPGTTCSDVSTDGGDRRGLVRAGLAVGAGLLLAALGLGMAAQAAHATTFPGTNGRIAGSGPLNTDPLNTGSKLELFTMNSAYNADLPFKTKTNNHDECRLTNNTNSDFNPRFSKDGTKIVYVKDNNLWTMQLDAQGRCPAAPSGPLAEPGDPKQLTNNGNTDSFVGGWCTTPTTPSQEWIVFQRRTTTHSFEVYKVQINSTREAVLGTETNLSNDLASDSQPSVRPDCSKIAFHSNRRIATPDPPATSPIGRNSDVWVMDFDGSNPTNLTASSNAEESAPSWSPGPLTTQGGTGSKYRIAFQTDRDTVSGQPRNLEIYRMDDEDGSNVKRLSYRAHSPAAGESGFDVTGFDLNPAYSPDGSKICFHSGRAAEFRDSNGTSINGQWEIYTLGAVNGEGTGGAAAQRKTNRSGNDERCGWQETP